MIKELKLITYNIDGLPEKLDLNDLPWIFKPIVWIYKLIKKTTMIVINDNQNKQKCVEDISKLLSEKDADIIAVQEDFNYHDELMSSLKEKYTCGTYTGGFDLSKIFSSTEWISCFPLPRFKCDGINIISKNNLSNETIVKWKKSYGYFTHANDLLTHKGFRYYQIKIDSELYVDVYILHMDADFYNAETCPDVSGDIEARKEQLTQLTNYIIDRYKNGSNNPIIIMGDTNSYNYYSWDVNNLNSYLLNPINETEGLEINEVSPNNGEDVDRVFYINLKKINYFIKPIECYYDKNFTNEYGKLSDHNPLITTINIETKK